MGASIGNYGEYSGGPTRQETYLYAKEVIQLMLASKAKKKALVIAGGVANFTDVKKTFAGIIDAFAEHVAAMRKQGIRVFVRRGGPNEKAGLALMRDFLTEQDLFGSVYGSDAVITQAVDDAVSFLKK
jgi:ATP-citrate lyase beta-subunit